ncbi:nuclear transport factor 2 family protein [Streptomyces alfalfae]|uniref:Nuclear transport factor 2 family protein n=1 Tax=Streptomyces alfalfae TaxID=1642299 RepID=A0A7T4U1L2_9ACTN|nr:nuclear transport factor 2 family protein [Streptomyces alfalfae]QQC92988.1 nuclear transport factor 2 family protein [Streptomyces alfalfae]
MTYDSSSTRADAPPASTPEEAFRQGIDLLLAKRFDAWIDLWAEDGVMEFPFAPPGAPCRLEGKAAVSAYMTAYPDHIDLTAIPYVEVHRTGDPDVVVVEMRSEGRAVATGHPFEMSYVAVVTVEEGLITHYRDYWNPLTALEIAGGADAPFVGAAR